MTSLFQSPRACISAIFATGVFVSGETAGHVGVDNQRTCIRKRQIRPSNLIRILLLQSSPGAGNCGRLAALHPCALPSALYYPKDRRGCTTYPIAPRQPFTRARMAWVVEFFRACRPVRFGSLVQPAKQPSSRLFEGFHSLLCWSLFHAVNLPKDFAHGVQRKSAYGARNDE